MTDYDISIVDELLARVRADNDRFALLVFDMDLRYVVAEGRPLSNVGLSAETILGRTMHEVLGEEAVGRLEPLYRRALSGDAFSVDFNVPQLPYLYRLSFFYQEPGEGEGEADVELAGVFIEQVDKTDQEGRLPAEFTSVPVQSYSGEMPLFRGHRQLRHLIEEAPFAVAMFDRDMTYLAHSRSWITDFNLNYDTPLNGMSHYALFPELDDERKKLFERTLEGETLERLEDPFPRADGSLDYVRWRNVPWYDDEWNVGGVMMFAQVVTDRVHNVQTLAMRAHELNVANRRLQRTNSRLEDANAELERFAYIASHDLREPLRMVTSYTQLLAHKLDPHLDDDTRRYLGFVLEGSTRMRELIDDLLELASVSTKSEPDREISLDEILDSTLLLLQESIRERDVVIERAPLPVAYASPSLMRQLFMNLIGNAIKFTPPERTPVVSIDSTVLDDETALRIRDNGIGIPEDRRDAIFEPFRRLHTREAYAGNGMGLAIVKKIATRYLGDVSVESTPGVGTSFIVSLPLALDPRAKDSP